MRWDLSVAELDAALARVKLAESFIPDHPRTKRARDLLQTACESILDAGGEITELVEADPASAWVDSEWLTAD